jgi:dihydrolipoamide dehydrogenase
MHASDMIAEIVLVIELDVDAVDIDKTTPGESIGMAEEVFDGVCTDLPPVRKNKIDSL